MTAQQDFHSTMSSQTLIVPIWTPLGLPSSKSLSLWSPFSAMYLSCWATVTCSSTENNGLKTQPRASNRNQGSVPTLWGVSQKKLFCCLFGFLLFCFWWSFWWGFVVQTGLTCFVGDSNWLAAGRAVSTTSYSIHGDSVVHARFEASDGSSGHGARHCKLLYRAASTWRGWGGKRSVMDLFKYTFSIIKKTQDNLICIKFKRGWCWFQWILRQFFSVQPNEKLNMHTEPPLKWLECSKCSFLQGADEDNLFSCKNKPCIWQSSLNMLQRS